VALLEATRPARFNTSSLAFGDPADKHYELVEVDRFGEIIISPCLDGLDRGLNGAEGRHDDHREIGIDLARFIRGPERVHPRDVAIREKDVVPVAPDRTDGIVHACDRKNVIALLDEVLLYPPALPFFIVHDQYAGFIHVFFCHLLQNQRISLHGA
jgi:hypothetical protein